MAKCPKCGKKVGDITFPGKFKVYEIQFAGHNFINPNDEYALYGIYPANIYKKSDGIYIGIIDNMNGQIISETRLADAFDEVTEESIRQFYAGFYEMEVPRHYIEEEKDDKIWMDEVIRRIATAKILIRPDTEATSADMDADESTRGEISKEFGQKALEKAKRQAKKLKPISSKYYSNFEWHVGNRAY